MFFIIVLLSFIVVGCENNFDPQIYGSFTQSNYPKSKDDYINLALACYIPYTGVWSYKMGTGVRGVPMYVVEQGAQRYFDACTDQMSPYTATGRGGDFGYFANANFAMCANYTREQIHHFSKILEVTRMTHIIGVLEDAPEEVLDVDTKKQLLGEVHLCRAMHMYYLLHIFGPLPVILNPDNIADDNELFSMNRPTLNEMCEWITDDLEYAIENIPEKVDEKGRYNKDYARFCLMRHCLNEGSHIENYYQRVIDLYGDLKGKYSLFKEGTNPYQEQFKSKNDFNCEVIMALSCSASANGSGNTGNFNPISMYMIPGDAADAGSGKNPEFDVFGSGWGHYYNMAKEFYDTFEYNDLRRNTIITKYYTKSGALRDENNVKVAWDGYIMNKWVPEVKATSQPMDYPLARWAEVLLIYAEALTRKNNTVDQDAINAVNDVRQRAGLSGLTSDKTSSVEQFLNAILDERGHELYFEGVRKIDLIRFNKYAQKTALVKGKTPSSQYVPIPNYAVIQASEHGINILQTYSRPGWEDDLASIK